MINMDEYKQTILEELSEDLELNFNKLDYGKIDDNTSIFIFPEEIGVTIVYNYTDHEEYLTRHKYTIRTLISSIVIYYYQTDKDYPDDYKLLFIDNDGIEITCRDYTVDSKIDDILPQVIVLEATGSSSSKRVSDNYLQKVVKNYIHEDGIYDNVYGDE